MESFKEFQGKDLDDCITQACEYYNSPREKLEIEIIQDAKSGIFGIVGARKAKIRAKKVSLSESVQSFIERPANAGKRRHKTRFENGYRDSQEKVKKKAAPARYDENSSKQQPLSEQSPAGRENDARFLPHNSSFRQSQDRNGDKGASQIAGFAGEPEPLDELDLVEGCFSPLAFDDLDKTRLEELTREVITTLVTPVAGKEIVFSVQIDRGQIQVNIDWRGDAGLLIGRDGQTLSALQYLASRIISRGMNSILRVHLDIGEYRRKQEEKICDLAKNLAEKARQTGRSFSTRPLSSYHRRLVHLCLQNDPDVLTRSAGDGLLKRVLVYPKRMNGRP